MATSPNPLFRPFLNPSDSPLSTGIAMPGSVPSMGTPILPSVSLAPPPPPTQTQKDSTERDRLINSGSGIDQIRNPLGRSIARAADITASVFAPRIAQFGPGTTLHHQMLVNQATQNVAKDQAEEQATAQTANEAATTAHTNAATDALQNPNDKFTPIQTDSGFAAFDPKTGKAAPVLGPDGTQVGTPDKTKPKSIEEQAYEYAVKSGKNPLDAFGAVYGAKNTKDAGLPQQYLDAISSGDTTKAALIKKVINDTSTQPKISVINAAAADRAAAKSAGLDTSDPAMQASVNAVANGSLKLSDVFGRGATTAQKAQFAAAVKAVNPNYNSGDHDIENSARRYMISGQGGQTLNAINTAYHHLDQFDSAAKALKNGDSKALNQIANELGVQVQNGASPQVVSDLVKNALKGEIAKAFTGAGATVDEQRNLDSSFNNANSLETMLGVSKQARALLRGKEESLKGQLDKGQQGQANFGALDDSSSGATEYTRVNGKLVPKVSK